MLRSLRYGEADRILHLYTPDRGRISAIAKGVRQDAVALRRQAGAVLPPQPRALRRPQRPAHGHQRRDARRPPAAARGRRGARRRGPRLRGRRARVRRRRPAPRRLPPARQRAHAARLRAGPRGPLERARVPAQAPARGRLRAPARRAARRAASATTWWASPAPPAASCAPPARRARSRSTRRRTTSSWPRSARPLAEAPDASPRALAAGRAGDPRDARAPRPCASQARRPGVGSPPWSSGSTTSPRARRTCATCSAARAPTSPR